MLWLLSSLSEHKRAEIWLQHSSVATYDGTRRDPRYLLGTIAYQLGNCHSQYNKLLGGEERIYRMLANSKLGLHELFTKLLEEPLSQCKSCMRKLVVIDALDESEYWSREDFPDLIMDRFPRLPK